MGCLYRITSPSGKSYIGISLKTAEERFLSHKSACIGGRSSGALYAAFRKYGVESFSIKTLVVASDWEYLCMLEISAITAFGTKAPHGYNVTSGGEGVVGYERSDVDRTKISKAQKIRYSDPIQKEKLIAQSIAANKASQEAAKERKRLGIKRSDAKDKPEKTKAYSDEWKAKVSAGVKKRYLDPEFRLKMQTSMQKRDVEVLRENGRKNAGSKRPPASNERKAKIKAAQLESWANPEVKTKRVAAMLAARKK